MTDRKMVIWGMSIIDPSEQGNTTIRWYHTDDYGWRWTSIKSVATLMKVEDAIKLMAIHDSLLQPTTFILKFVP